MTDVSKTGAFNPVVQNRQTAATAKPSKTQSADSAKGADKAEGASASRATPELPRGLTIAGEAVRTDSAQHAVESALDRLEISFGQTQDNPPASGQQLEDFLGEIKLAAPFLDKALAARDAEIKASGDAGAAARDELNALIGHAQDVLSQARDQLEQVAANLTDGATAEDPAVAQVLSDILGPDHAIPTFSDEELAQGRQEYVGLVFDEIAGALSRHQGDGAAAATAGAVFGAFRGTDLNA